MSVRLRGGDKGLANKRPDAGRGRFGAAHVRTSGHVSTSVRLADLCSVTFLGNRVGQRGGDWAFHHTRVRLPRLEAGRRHSRRAISASFKHCHPIGAEAWPPAIFPLPAAGVAMLSQEEVERAVTSHPPQPLANQNLTDFNIQLEPFFS